ncbi:MAG: maleylpyruvate isomerase family mycothiol-dependent enzyme [Nocardioidaceae bacterium]
MTADMEARIDALTTSALALEHSIADLSDEQAAEPSLLPGWTRAHVLTHIARNADAMVNLVTWARTRVETAMYPSREKRDADIEAGAGSPAAELVADVRGSQQRLMAAVAEMADDDWHGPIRFGQRNTPGTGEDIPDLRRTEVEVHHVDLDLDYTLAHWPEDFVESMLRQTANDFSGREGAPAFTLVGLDGEGRWEVAGGGTEITGPPPALLGWLLGRTDGLGLHSDQSLPTLGVWR